MTTDPLYPRRAFSISEVLIVMVILAVLGTLLFSSAQKIKENGRAIRCLNGLRTYGAAFAAYHNDNSQKCVTPGYASGDNNQLWNYVLNKGLYLDFAAQRALYCPSLNDSSYLVAGKTEAERVREGYVNGVGYGYNSWLANKRVHEIEALTKTLLLGECYLDVRVLSGTAATNRYAYRHSGGRNLLFLDGHVENWAAHIPYPTFTNSFWAYPPR